MIYSNIKPFTYDVFTDVADYLNTQFFYERDRLLYQWLIRAYRNIIDTPPARRAFSYANELVILFEVLLPKIAQIEHEAKRVKHHNNCS